MSKHQPNTEDIYSLMGATLSYLQSVEKVLRLVTTFVIQDSDSLDFNKFQSIERKEAKKTLGYFMARLRERADIFPAFDELLESFLNKRNDFIHNHASIPGWDLDTEQGRAVARQFTSSILLQAQKINEVFIALIIRWQSEAGIQTPMELEHPFFQNIEVQYGHLIDTFFTRKET